MRPLCQACNKNPAAINCHKNNKVYYRSRCSICIRRGKNLPKQIPKWQAAGYIKKKQCDGCGFTARLPAHQLTVYHADGNLANCDYRNLKTICLNCAAEFTRIDRPWRRGDLEADV
jgi:hypothetical protein